MKTDSWKELLNDKRELTVAIITVVIAVFSVASYTNFLRGVEGRIGVVFTDPIHQLIGPFDLSWPIFIILYGALLGAIAITFRSPLLIFRMIRAYTILIALRMLLMWMLPLDPPTTMITLADPFVEVFTSGSGAPLTRDLFFSGHTSLLFMVGLLMPTKTTRTIYLSLAAVIGAAVILQHVHYSVDVAVAPLAAITAVALVGGQRKR